MFVRCDQFRSSFPVLRPDKIAIVITFSEGRDRSITKPAILGINNVLRQESTIHTAAVLPI
jgi:hypothetical protein